MWVEPNRIGGFEPWTWVKFCNEHAFYTQTLTQTTDRKVWRAAIGASATPTSLTVDSTLNRQSE